MGGIRIPVDVDDRGNAKLGKLNDNLEKIGDKSTKAGKKFTVSFKKMRDSAGKTADAVKRVSTSMQAMILGAATGAGIGMLVKQGIAMNAELESIETQFKVMYKDADRAAAKMQELVEFSASTPFQLAEIANGARILEAFGLSGGENLRVVGDAAAAAQRPIEEVAMTFGRIKSGAFGEAFMRLGEMGLATREMLEAEGLQFNKSGSYVGSAEDAINAVKRIMTSRFGGMMGEMSGTWKGAMSTLKDNWGLFTGALTKPLFEKLKPKIAGLTEKIQAMMATDKVAQWGGQLATTIGGFIDWIEKAVTWTVRFASEHQVLISWIGQSAQAFGILAGAILVVGAALSINPFVFVAAAIAAVVGWTWKAAKALGGWGEGLKALGGALKGTAVYIGDIFVALGGVIVEALKLSVQWVWTNFLSLGERLSVWARSAGEIFVGLGKVIFKALTFQFDDMKAEWETLKTALSDTMIESAEAAASVAGPAWSSLGEKLGNVTAAATKDTLKNAWNLGDLLPPDMDTGLDGLGADGGGGGAQGPPIAPPDTAPAMAEIISFEEFLKERNAVIEDEILGGVSSAWSATWDTMLFESEDKAEAMKRIVTNLGQSIVGTFVKMAGQEVIASAKGALARAAYEKTVTAAALKGAAARTAAATAETAASEIQTGADMKGAAAGTFKAHSGIPFVGAIIAAGMVALMLKTMGAFRAGGLIGGGGSGVEDDKYIRASGGEFMQPAAAVSHYGQDFMEAVRTQTFDPGGGSVLNLTLNGGGDGLTEEEVEEALVPLMERLGERRRLKLA